MSSSKNIGLSCDESVRKAFTEAKQWYGALRLADELPDYNIKTIAASLRYQGLRAKAARSVAKNTVCPRQRIC